MKKDFPLVSICVAAYKHENYIDSLMLSLTEQTYKNIELIIIDDCSPDSTFLKILAWKDRLRNRFNRVVIERNETNLGVVKTVNRLIRRCKGKYIKHMASDDILLKDGISILVEFYEKNPLFDGIFSNAVCIDKNDSYPLSSTKKFRTYYRQIPCLEGNLFQRLLEEDFINAPSSMFLKRTYIKYGLHDEKAVSEDWDYWLRIVQNGEIGYCDRITVGYRITGDALSHFSDSNSGRKRLRNMYKGELYIIKKYHFVSNVNIRYVYNSFFNRMLNLAIDCNDKYLIKKLMIYICRYNFALKTDTKMKLFFYKIHLLKMIQKIKRFIGLPTGGEL